MDSSASLKLNINELPAPTWRWLKMNGSSLRIASPAPAALEPDALPDGVSAAKTAEPWRFATSAGKDVDALLDGIGAERVRYTLAGGSAVLRFSPCFSGEAASAEFEAGEGAHLGVIMDFSGGEAVAQTRFKLSKGAEVTLVQIHSLESGAKFVNDLGALVGDGAKFNVVQLVESGGEIYLGSYATLAGEESFFKSGLGYFCSGGKLDVNCVSRHEGVKSECDIRAYGALRDGGDKIFRGTIDFRNGAIGARGNESEDALLLDDTVVNRTVPLILCREEDVEGTHGATIGKIDEAMMFYLNSRGISESEAYGMLARSRLSAACRMIDDPSVRAEVMAGLGDGADGDE